MTAHSPVTGKISAAKTGLILVFLVAVWLAFVVMPSRKAEPAKVPREHLLDSKLNAVGLRDDADFEGLPEIFSIWADKAEWINGRTRFAYRHPVMKTYSYYFEAVRVGEKFHFNEIAEPKEPGYEWDDSLGEECPIRFYRTYSPLPVAQRSGLSIAPTASQEIKLKVEVTAPKIAIPPAELVLRNFQPKH